MYLLKKKRVKSVSNLAGWIKKFLIPSKLETNFTMKKILNNYKIWRNKVKSLIFKSKQEFFNDAINSNVKYPEKKTMGNSATNYI